MRGGITLRPAFGLALLAAIVAVAGSAPPANAAPDGFITRAGTQLYLDNQPYRFSGINIYNANNFTGCWYPMASGSELDDALTGTPGGGPKVIRAWFFQALATTGGVRDWSGIDHTLQQAAAHGVKVIPTLANQWIDCDGPEGGAGAYKDEAWYVSGYTQPDPGGTVSYRDWVAEIVNRYKDDPTILAWQLMNEAEVKPSIDSPACSDFAVDKLWAFASDVSGLIKSIDPDHLVSIGTMGGGQCGAQGPEYEYLHSIETIDLCEYHDYGSPNVAMPGDQWNGLQVRIGQCNALGKPLFVGETGIRQEDVASLQERSDLFRAKFEAQFAAGVVGQLVWAWNKDGSVGTYDIGPGDPVLALLDEFRGDAEFTIVNLGTLGGSLSFGHAINESGQVVGLSRTPGDVELHAALWDEGQITDLGTLGGDYSSAYGISDAGAVVGTSKTADGEQHAFRWEDGLMTDLGTLPGGTLSSAFGVSEDGTAVGYSERADGAWRAVLWEPDGSIVDLGTLSANPAFQWSIAWGISAGGVVAGRSNIDIGGDHAFRWTQGGGMEDIDGSSGHQSMARALNDAGVIVGERSPMVGGSPHAFSWTQAGGMEDLGTLGGTQSGATAVNEAGETVGWSAPAGDFATHGFLWTEIWGMQDLGTLGGTYGAAQGIADDGAIVGTSTTADGAYRATVWVRTGTDADDDGIEDAIDTGDGTFEDGGTTGGEITGNPGGHTVTVSDLPDPDGVRITVDGTGTVQVTITFTNPVTGDPCGTIEALPGTVVEVTCGSITVTVAPGSPPVTILVSPTTSLFVSAGQSVTVEIDDDGSFVVEEGTVAVFRGFDSPIANGGVLNQAKSGSTVPVKWRLATGSGSPITNLVSAAVSSRPVDCNTRQSTGPAVAGATSALKRQGKGNYALEWTTEKGWTGCRQMKLSLAGTAAGQDAYFRFK